MQNRRSLQTKQAARVGKAAMSPFCAQKVGGQLHPPVCAHGQEDGCIPCYVPHSAPTGGNWDPGSHSAVMGHFPSQQAPCP